MVQLDELIVNSQNESALSIGQPETWRSLRTDARSSIGRILDAARHLLADPGAVTLNRVAEEAGVGIATLYRHFPNRRALARAVLDRVFDEDAEPLMEEFASSDASREDLLAVAGRLVELLQRERRLIEEVGDLTEVTIHLLGRDGRLAGTVERAQAAGNLRPDLTADDLPVLLAMVATGSGLLDAPPLARERYLSLLLDGLNPSRAVSVSSGATASVLP
jgi:AcrR family transcriptional regulator